MLNFLITSAYAQGSGDLPSSGGFGGPAGELLILAIACVAFLALVKVFSRWPKAEPWLLAAAIAAFIPLASFLLFMVTGGAANHYETAPGVVIASLVLGVVWCLAKTKTSWLGVPAAGKSATGSFAGASLLLIVPMALFWLFEFRNILQVLYTAEGRFLLACIVAYAVGCTWWFLQTGSLRLKSGSGDRLDEITGSEQLSSRRKPRVSNAPPARDLEREVPGMDQHAGTRIVPAVTAPIQSESLPTQPGAHSKIFISYRRQDSADITGRIYDRLIQRFGKEQIFKDVDSIPLGVDFREHLNRMVGNCDVVLAVMGDRWLTADDPDRKRRLDDPKDFVRIELEAALERKIPVIPVLVREAQMPKEKELPAALAALAYRNGIAVRTDPDFHHDMDRLIAGVESHFSNRS